MVPTLYTLPSASPPPHLVISSSIRSHGALLDSVLSGSIHGPHQHMELASTLDLLPRERVRGVERVET